MLKVPLTLKLRVATSRFGSWGRGPVAPRRWRAILAMTSGHQHGQACRTSAARIDDLSVDEKIDHLQSVWNRIAATPETIPVPDWHREIIDERLKRSKPTQMRATVGRLFRNARQNCDNRH